MVTLWLRWERPRDLPGSILQLVKPGTHIGFMQWRKISFPLSAMLLVGSLGTFVISNLNYGIDFQGGTSIRTESTTPVDVAAYRSALEVLELGDISIAEVDDPLFDEDQHVALVRVQAQEGDERIASETIEAIQAALRTIDPDMTFPSVESVGPKVSGELIQTALIAVALAVVAILLYIWLRFEWQFAIGAVLALSHDVILTIGIFSELQSKFDLAIIAALLTIVGYSINDTVIVFDRVRENLRKYKKKDLKDVLNISINETLSRTLMTSVTTLLALISLFVLGGDVIRGFVFAMIWGVIIGTYSSIFVASAILLVLGVKRDWSKKDPSAGTRYGHIDT